MDLLEGVVMARRRYKVEEISSSFRRQDRLRRVQHLRPRPDSGGRGLRPWTSLLFITLHLRPRWERGLEVLCELEVLHEFLLDVGSLNGGKFTVPCRPRRRCRRLHLLRMQSLLGNQLRRHYVLRA